MWQSRGFITMRVCFKRSLVAVSVTGVLCATSSAYATNGMNLEGYGPEATAMGGVSQAYDNGAAAMMNNPATIGMMDTTNRIDIAIGNLRPDISVTDPSGMQKADSTADSFFMPAFGYLRKVNSRFTTGVGIYSQGGMGTEYKKDSWMASGTNEPARSEVGVGRLIVPMNYAVNSRFNIGGSVDFVWGGMDLQMAMPVMVNPATGAPTNMGIAPAGTFGDLLGFPPGSNTMGEVTLSPGLGSAANGLIAAGYNTVRMNFSNDSDFTGEAKGYGIGAKIGLTYAINPALNFGASYHSRTKMSDWKTDSSSASMEFYEVGGALPTQTLTGEMAVKNFQWPAQWAAGIAYMPGNWMFGVDINYIQWKDVMESFQMTFTADDSAGLGGETADITFYQSWKNQTVVKIGGSYDISRAFTWRAGLNLANNPIPDAYVNPLFPATIKNHVTTGFGWNITQKDAIDFSIAYAPEVKVNNTNTGVQISHSQTNWQLGYNRRW